MSYSSSFKSTISLNAVSIFEKKNAPVIENINRIDGFKFLHVNRIRSFKIFASANLNPIIQIIS